MRCASKTLLPPSAGVAQWLFEGDLRDTSRHSHDLSGKEVAFAAVPGGQALRSGRSLQVASHPDLQLSPGFRIDCSVYFETLPTETRQIAIKNGEYQLRLDSAKEGGCFALFFDLDGWEPRITSAEPVVAGRWYRLTARWDGFIASLEVNGQRSHQARSGLAKATNNPLVIGGLGGLIDNLRIENPRLPTLRVANTRQAHAILLAGRPEKMSTPVRNIGTPSGHVVVRIELPQGMRGLGPTICDLGAMPTGVERTIDWGVEADAPAIAAARLHVSAAGAPPMIVRHPLVFFSSEDSLPPSASANLPVKSAGDGKATTWYIDSVEGNNANAGTSLKAAWKDFTNINGRVLGPGERLLLRRGSVFNQELNVSARGTADHWTEIGAYGDGARPILRRNWDIDDRCALMLNPDSLHVSSLVFCYAAKGLIVTYNESGHRGLLIEDCIAHHVEGLYRFNSHGIPEWRGRVGAPGDGLTHSSGIGIAGHPARDLVLRDCEMFQCSSGYMVHGEDVLVDRVFCHDNFCHNTSPHPFLVDVRRAILQNSLFDASGWHASAGTMGIMLGGNDGLIIRNCYFRNQPDSGSADEGGIDFENRGCGCLIDHCTFQNNAGAGIEVLGLRSPQTTNIEIRNSRFIQNNTAKKLGPAEVYVWGLSRDPSICCSTGIVRDCGYVLLPGIQFFVNEAPTLTSWSLSNNIQYADVGAIERAMPRDRPPRVEVGAEIRTDRPTVRLSGRVQSGSPTEGSVPAVTWELLEGPGRVAFENAHSLATSAAFDRPGDYLLRLVARERQFWHSDRLVVHILPPGKSVTAAWEFNKNLDKQGWTEVNPGTRRQVWPDPLWSTTADPVKLVVGGFYILAIEKSPDAHILSADHLGIDLTGKQSITLRFQNHTPATEMRVRFTTEADGAWDDAKSRSFAVIANDNDPRTYTIDLSSIPAWHGRLRQLRLDLATGKPLTGTCRFDYIWITSDTMRK